MELPFGHAMHETTADVQSLYNKAPDEEAHENQPRGTSSVDCDVNGGIKVKGRGESLGPSSKWSVDLSTELDRRTYQNGPHELMMG